MKFSFGILESLKLRHETLFFELLLKEPQPQLVRAEGSEQRHWA